MNGFGMGPEDKPKLKPGKRIVVRSGYRKTNILSIAMATVTVSPKYQVVIPLKVRKTLNIKPGQKVEVFAFDNRIELVPVKPMKQMKGFLRGIDTRVEREPDREL